MAEEAMGVSTASLVAPAGDERVGGDFQHVEDVGCRTVLVVGDVAGNGSSAAPYADRLCTTLGDLMRGSDDPACLLEGLNAEIYADSSFDRFVTACALILDRSARSASWAFAGHLPPHWVDSGLPVDGARPGLPLGVDPECGAASAERRPLHRGEGFVLFTDGLEDVRGPGGDRFGSARVTRLLGTELRLAPPEEIVRVLKEEACKFGEGQLADDLCIVAVRVT
jgi:serine phosphatase RsbU (regulator of sigma subunit)